MAPYAGFGVTCLWCLGGGSCIWRSGRRSGPGWAKRAASAAMRHENRPAATFAGSPQLHLGLPVVWCEARIWGEVVPCEAPVAPAPGAR